MSVAMAEMRYTEILRQGDRQIGHAEVIAVIRKSGGARDAAAIAAAGEHIFLTMMDSPSAQASWVSANPSIDKELRNLETVERNFSRRSLTY